MYKEVILPSDHYAAGFTIGEQSREAMQYILQSPVWSRLLKWKNTPLFHHMQDQAAAAFPEYMAEIQGMAAGAGQDVTDVFLWNCRGDFLPLADTGCTTLCCNTGSAIFVGHNEDGDPHFKNHCFISKTEGFPNQPDQSGQSDQPGYLSFTYPASLNGHTFALNTFGLVQAVDNIRSQKGGEGIPRMFLSRAVLDCKDIEGAVALVKRYTCTGAFHHLIAQMTAQDTERNKACRAVSIETGGSNPSIHYIDGFYGHANHYIHPENHLLKQIITDSAAARQHRVDALAANMPASSKTGIDTLRAILKDRENENLPIFRTDPDDPDDENNLAMALFRLDETGVECTIEAPDAGGSDYLCRFCPSNDLVNHS